ncbi:MAG: hypothetical protein IJQ71_10140 [Clostridia bacterium]|nr:hypothetical protein [Clostridia bacterium]
MRKIISLLLTLCLLAGCSMAGAESPHFEGKPWINSNFYGLWPSEQPAVEESFELYANYDRYMDALAKEVRKFMPLDEAQKLAIQQEVSLCTDPALTCPEAECMRIVYALYTGTKQGEEAIAPLLPYAERLRAAKTEEELAAVIREDGWLYGNAFFSSDLKTIDRETGIYYLTLSPTDPIDYLPPDEETFDIERDIDGTKEKLRRLGWSEEEIPQVFEKIFAYYDPTIPGETGDELELEKELKLRKPLRVSLEEIREICPMLYELFRARGLEREGAGTTQAYGVEITELKKIRVLWERDDLDTIKGILALSMYNAAAKVLPKEGASDPATTLTYLLPRVLREQGYVHSFVPQERIDLYKELANEYKEAFRARIEKNDWVSEETKKEIYRKLDKMVASDILYPDGAFDCTALLEKLRGCDNVIEAYAWCSWFSHRCEAYYAGREYVPGNRLGSENLTITAEGRYEPTVNAFYLGGASLCDYMLDMTSRETILGTFGAHISHEMSHAFDTRGSQDNADYTGTLFATEKDQEIFNRKVEAIKKQINSLEVFDGVYSDGEMQIGEFLADITGMSLTLDMVRDTENFDYDAYFRAFAYFFINIIPSRETTDPESAHYIHPYCYLRINFAVQHFEEFYRTYPSVTEGTPMYMAPEDRILVW